MVCPLCPVVRAVSEQPILGPGLSPAARPSGLPSPPQSRFDRRWHQSIYGGSIMRAVLTLLLVFVGWSSVVEAAIGMEACTRHTAVGIGCYCNRAIVSTHQFPGWIHASGPFYKPMYVRPGWHVTNTKGMHSSGNVCYKDRMATPEERAEFLRERRR